SSVSETEMSHFSALASSWWDPHGPSRILHLMNPLRHTFIQRCRNSIPPPAAATTTTPQRQKLKYLDIGCGGGIFAESAARLPSTASVTAIDPTSMVIEVARKHQRTDPLLLEPGRLNYVNTAIENLPRPSTPDRGVDVLTLFEVIEHIEKPAPFLANCLAHVRPGGWLILSTMSRTWTSWLTTIVAAEDMMRVVPRGTHDWKQYINADEMRAWAAKQEGWGHAQAMGVVYIPGLGWREVPGSESWGNYFFGIRKN
ncbi:hexaprenyldihydroxybenzoate methyltransferase mitochondrial precursor, partial [Delphinella strobiligena]